MKIYFDNNATTPMRDEVKQEIINILGQPLNPSSIHIYGQHARNITEVARRYILSKFAHDDLIFTATGTEANNLALSQSNEIITSEIEHMSILRPKNSKKVRVNQDGIIDLDDLEQKLKESKHGLVSIAAVNNEIGVIQPVKEIAKLAKKYNALCHCDAVQSFGKIDLDLSDYDMVTIAGHKIGGPHIAALIYKNIDIKPMILGGGQEKNKRAGTEDVALINGFKKAVELIDVKKYAEIAILRDFLELSLNNITKDVKFHGSNRVPNTSSISMPGKESSIQLMQFDLASIAVSSGSACSSGKVSSSHVLKALYGHEINNAIRVSLGTENTKDEVDYFIKIWKEIYES